MLPLYLEISSDDKESGDKKYEKMDVLVSKATKQLGEEFPMATEVLPNSDMVGTCYTGTGGKAVVDLVFEMAGSFYTEQMNLWGWKYKKQSRLGESIAEQEGEKGETERALNKGSKLWSEWRGNGEAVLLVIAISDDGDDMNDTIIPKCK